MATAVVAGLTLIAGVVLFVSTITGGRPVVALRTEVTAGSTSTWVESSEWLGHDHDAHDHGDEDEGGDASATDDGLLSLGPDASNAANELTTESGFAMPAQMMPGTPDEGFLRLQVELTFMNRGAVATAVDPQAFHLESADGDRWDSLLGGTFNPMALASRHSLNTVVAFDVPEEAASSAMYLVWTPEGQDEIRFAVAEGQHH